MSCFKKQNNSLYGKMAKFKGKSVHTELVIGRGEKREEKKTEKKNSNKFQLKDHSSMAG